MTSLFRGHAPDVISAMSTNGAHTFLASLFLASWAAAMFVVVFGLVLAAMTVSYTRYRRQAYYRDTAELRDYELVEHLIKQFKQWLGLTRQKPVRMSPFHFCIISLCYSSSCSGSRDRNL